MGKVLLFALAHHAHHVSPKVPLWSLPERPEVLELILDEPRTDAFLGLRLGPLQAGLSSRKEPTLKLTLEFR